MFEKYRVLGAMAALREFTVADLARLSEVKSRTVQTVLDRNTDLHKEIGRASTGARGGSYVRYRLAPGAEEKLLGILQELESAGAIPRPQRAETPGRLPSELVAAEYTVLTEFPEAENADERRRLLDLARTSLEDIRSDMALNHSPDTRIEAHCRILDFLIRLSEHELAVEDGLELGPSSTELLREFVALSPDVQLTDERVLEQVRARLENALNPFHQQPRRTGARANVIVVTDSEEYVEDSTSRVAAVLEEEVGSDLIQVASLDVETRLAELAAEMHGLFVFSLVAAQQARWPQALSAMQAVRRAGSEVVVFADRWEPALANQVQESRAAYVPMEGLSREGIVGAICQHLPGSELS
jgi:hypothetical protein